MTGPAPAGDDERLAWAYLARVAEPPSEPVRALVEQIGAVEAADAIRRRVIPAGHRAVVDCTEARWDTDCATDDLIIAEQIGARLVTPHDDEWPGWSLLPLGLAETSARGGEPLALWVRGSHRLDDAVSAAIALIGSRACTSYGEHVASTLASGLCADGWTVVSGGAFGIDVAAHRAALASGGLTVAVLACGIDRDYPATHSRVFEEIAARGLVVSEYPPGTSAAKHRFLTRNRLVAALSKAVVVVEAGKRSGAANTAAWARTFGRPLGAVPGSVTSAMSVGCHRLIADDLATLVTDVDGVIALASPDGSGDPGRGHSRPTDDLDPTQKRVHDAIPGRGTVTIDEIAFSSGVDIATVRAALALMEVDGHVVGSDAGWRLA